MEDTAFLQGEEHSESRDGDARQLWVVRPRESFAVRRRTVLGCFAAATLAALALWHRSPSDASPKTAAADDEAEQLWQSSWGSAWGGLFSRPEPKPAPPRGYSEFLSKPPAEAEKMSAKAIKYAESLYNQTVAEAFAALAKLSYCGNLPGIYGTVASSCSLWGVPGVSTTCEKSGFEVVPGFVKTLTVTGQDSLFGYAAKVQGVSEESPVSKGVVISIRGSINSMNSSVMDKKTTVSTDIAGCKGCSVHEGYSEEYGKLKHALDDALIEFDCFPGDCTVHVTGHGSGAAIAAIAAWELSTSNYTIGTSYVFGMPQVGCEKFAEHMNERFTGKEGPIFQVTFGKDSVTRWPFEGNFKSWGVEAHYEDLNTTKPQLCMAGTEGCGVKQYTKYQLTATDHCKSALAPDGDMCKFSYWSMQCYGGLGFEVAQNVMDGYKALPEHLRPLVNWPQPHDMRADHWHPSSKDGEQKKALSHATIAKDYFSMNTLKAFAALAKISYCGPASGVQNSVLSSCKGSSGVCSKAGFGLVPHSVSEVSAPFNGSADAFFFYTALMRRTTADFAKAPYFLPAEACVLAFRGTANKANIRMNQMSSLVDLDDSGCPGCQVQQGVYTAWKANLEEMVVDALGKSGCKPFKANTTTRKVFLVGHSMGGTMMTMASYFLQKAGFQVQLSWILEGGRPGNHAFMDYVYQKMFSETRPVALWHATHENDGIPRWPAASKEGYGYHQMQVFFNSSDASNYSFCIGNGKNDGYADGACGIFRFPRGKLNFRLPSTQHCSLPYAPNGEMCMLGYPSGSFKTDMQCYYGGSIMSRSPWR